MKNIAQTFIVLSIILFSCTKEEEIKKELPVQKKVIDIKMLKHIEVGLTENFEKLPLLDFTEITKEEYKNLKSTANTITNSPLHEKDDNYVLEINNRILQLRSLANTLKEGETQYKYLGFYPSLNIYAFSANSIGDGLGFSELNLINATNSYVYSIVSPGDDTVENPVISPNTKYLAYCYNYIYDKNKSFLGILKINNNQTFIEYRSFSSDYFDIKEIVWLGDDYIGIKVTNDDSKTFKYYKANLSFTNNKSSNLSNIDGNYNIYIETEATSTGMASISYSFTIKDKEAILKTNTYHESIRCNGKYVIKENNNILELYYNDTEEECKSDSPVFYIKKEGAKYYIKGVGGEATFNEWILLEKE